MMANYEICWIHWYNNAMFDWQTYNFILIAAVANKLIKRKYGLHFGVSFLNWKVLSSKTFAVCSYAPNMSEATCRKKLHMEIWSTCTFVILPLKKYNLDFLYAVNIIVCLTGWQNNAKACSQQENWQFDYFACSRQDDVNN